MKTGIDLYSKSVKQCICLIDGKIPTDSDMLDGVQTDKGNGKKKSKQPIEERMKTINVVLLIPEVYLCFY